MILGAIFFNMFEISSITYLMYLSLETVTSIIKTSLSQTTLYYWNPWLSLLQSSSSGFLSFDPTIRATVAFTTLIMLFQIPSTFLQTQKGMPIFIKQVMTLLCWLGQLLQSYLRDVPWEDIFKLGASSAATEFYPGWNHFN